MKIDTNKNLFKKKYINNTNSSNFYYDLKRYTFIVADLLKKNANKIQNVNTLKMKYF
jgi:hypothetical protein